MYALLPFDGVFDEAYAAPMGGQARIQCIFTWSFAGFAGVRVTYAEIALPTLHMEECLVDQPKARSFWVSCPAVHR